MSQKSFDWYSQKTRVVVYQIALILGLVWAVYYLYSNASHSLSQQNIASGFGFLTQEAGFEISESVIEYWSDDTYFRALLVGLLNTLKVAVIGNIFAVILGVIVGICRLSSNWMLSKISQVYIEGLRNIPLLLQLFFWYALFSDIFPSIRQAHNPLPYVFLSQRGLVIPTFSEHPIWLWVFLSFILGAVLSFVVFFRFKKQREQTGKLKKTWPYSLFFLIGLPLLVWFFGGAPLEIDYPELGGFNFNGGYTFTPEFLSLMLGLVLYTSAFIAEIVRSGVLSVDHGQWEASQSLGLNSTQTMGLVILPQALRVIVPPLTSQLLNLTKNSSLAVGIGYPDFVSVANTTMNQTGQAIELVSLIIVVYLFFSLVTSFLMNLYNKQIELKER